MTNTQIESSTEVLALLRTSMRMRPAHEAGQAAGASSLFPRHSLTLRVSGSRLDNVDAVCSASRRAKSASWMQRASLRRGQRWGRAASHIQCTRQYFWLEGWF